MKNIFLCLLLVVGSSLNADAESQYSVVVTLDAGESVLIRSKGCDKCKLIKYDDLSNVQTKGLSIDESYVIEYEVVYYQCLSCGEYVIAGKECPNKYCPSNWN